MIVTFFSILLNLFVSTSASSEATTSAKSQNSSDVQSMNMYGGSGTWVGKVVEDGN
ncbi:hypothetical protein GCM10028895_04420 [Pontibacter rugosus]